MQDCNHLRSFMLRQKMKEGWQMKGKKENEESERSNEYIDTLISEGRKKEKKKREKTEADR